MRSYAPYKSLTALMVLSLLSALMGLSPAVLMASTRHTRRTAQETSKKPSAKRHAPATHKAPSGRKQSRNAAKAPAVPHSKAHRRHKQQVDDAADPVTVNRVHAWERTKQKSAAQQSAQAKDVAADGAEASGQDTGKATTQDFLKAASPAGAAAEQERGTSKPSDGDTTPRSGGPMSRRQPNPAKPASVVSVVRPTTERPQLPSVQQEASTPEILPPTRNTFNIYNKRGRLIMPPPLRGSREILLHQNEMANREGLDRIQNDDDIDIMRQQRTLVALPLSGELGVDERLPSNRRYCRPWTAEFLRNLARAHYAQFHTPLQVNSAVRTVEFQHKLLRTNGNAAPAEGDLASPHLTGQTIDLAKHGLSMTEIAWMRGYLLPLVQQGKVDVEEEFQQSCFHVSVYKRYMPLGEVPRREIATTHRAKTGVLAAAMP